MIGLVPGFIGHTIGTARQSTTISFDPFRKWAILLGKILELNDKMPWQHVILIILVYMRVGVPEFSRNLVLHNSPLLTICFGSTISLE